MLNRKVMTPPEPIVIVQGAQWGSEAKGMVAAALCENRDIDYAVRTGAVNAGHTVYYNGVAYKMQQLPTGWVNPGTALVIGAGAYVNPDILRDEIYMVKKATGRHPNVIVDVKAGLHLPEHTDRSGASGRHYLIGATGKGCSEAITDRIRLRGKGGKLFRDYCNDNPEYPGRMFSFGNTEELLNDAYDNGQKILLEGTQGTLLDLYLGPYPFTTHKQCTASQWVTEAGLSPSLDYEIVLVARTYPIRVAGNSGPMPEEIDWPTLAFEINQKLIEQGNKPLVDPSALYLFNEAYVALDTAYSNENVKLSERNKDAIMSLQPDTREELMKLFEFTTVTKKLRRVARLDMDSLRYSVKVNRPAWIALTFANYEYPELWGEQTTETLYRHAGLSGYITRMQQELGVMIGAITTGPESRHYHDYYGG